MLTKEVEMEENGKEESTMDEHVHDELAQKTCTSGKMDTSKRVAWITYLQKTYLMIVASWPKVLFCGRLGD